MKVQGLSFDNSMQTHSKLRVGIAAGNGQMEAEAQNEHLTDLRDQFPFERMTRVCGGHAQRDQLPLLEQIQ